MVHSHGASCINNVFVTVVAFWSIGLLFLKERFKLTGGVAGWGLLGAIVALIMIRSFPSHTICMILDVQ